MSLESMLNLTRHPGAKGRVLDLDRVGQANSKWSLPSSIKGQMAP